MTYTDFEDEYINLVFSFLIRNSDCASKISDLIEKVPESWVDLADEEMCKNRLLKIERTGD